MCSYKKPVGEKKKKSIPSTNFSFFIPRTYVPWFLGMAVPAALLSADTRDGQPEQLSVSCHEN